MTDLALRDEALPPILNPRTGEIVDQGDLPGVADALDALREYVGNVHGAIKVCELLLVNEARRRGTKTVHLPNVTAEIHSDRDVEWEPEKLEAALRRAGLPEDEIEQVVKKTVTYRVDARRAERLITSGNEKYARAVKRYRREVPKPGKVRLKKGAKR